MYFVQPDMGLRAAAVTLSLILSRQQQIAVAEGPFPDSAVRLVATVDSKKRALRVYLVERGPG